MHEGIKLFLMKIRIKRKWCDPGWWWSNMWC